MQINNKNRELVISKNQSSRYKLKGIGSKHLSKQILNYFNDLDFIYSYLIS
jgi:hypothetical protein